jgi:hypothetical protein
LDEPDFCGTMHPQRAALFQLFHFRNSDILVKIFWLRYSGLEGHPV